MSLGQWVLLAYAVLLFAGGFIGYQKAGSKPSLIAGTAGAVWLVVALALTLRPEPALGYWTGFAAAAVFCVVFAIRLRKTGKVMPSGALLGLSAVCGLLLLWSAWTAPGPESTGLRPGAGAASRAVARAIARE